MDLTGKRIAILVEQMYEDMEFWYPYYRLKEAGATVEALGTGQAEYPSKHGYPIKVDNDIHKVSSAVYHGVVIPGGQAPDFLRSYEAVTKFVEEMFFASKPIAAICHGLWVPVSARILSGLTITCYSSIKDDVINAGATYVDKEVCVDRNIVSSRKPDDLPAFMREFMKMVKESTVQVQTANIQTQTAKASSTETRTKKTSS